MYYNYYYVLNNYGCTLLVLYVIVFTDHILNALKGTPMNIYIICPMHPFIGCGHCVDTIYSHWNTSKFVRM